MTSPWWVARRAVPQARGRIVCLPYAGGAASVYRTWHGNVPADVEVCPAELPGRGARFGEQPHRRVAPLVRDLADALESLLDLPYVLYGHSMGGLVAFELVRLLRRRRWPVPRHLVVAASPDPRRGHHERWHDVDDERLRARLRALGGTPADLLDDDELMSLVLPVLRADFEVVETYTYRPEDPLDVPMTVLGGVHDEMVRPADLDGWRVHGKQVAVELLARAHFFTDGLAPRVAALLENPGPVPVVTATTDGAP